MNALDRPGVVRRPATYGDLLAAPEHMVAELIRGALHLQPRPAMRHGRVASALAGKVGSPFDYDDDGPGGWWIVMKPELHLGDDVLVPDLAGWRRERMPIFPDAAACDLAPDWVCEVLSPATRQRDLTDKREIYGEHGLPWLWLVDPLARTLECLALREGLWTLVAAHGGDARTRVAPFDAIELPLSALWPPAPPADHAEPARS